MLQRDSGAGRDLLVRAYKFDLGKVQITPQARAGVPPSELFHALRRHALGDWGDLSAEDRAVNDGALAKREQLLSVYRMKSGRSIWVVTDADRASTTVLLPKDSDAVQR